MSSRRIGSWARFRIIPSVSERPKIAPLAALALCIAGGALLGGSAARAQLDARPIVFSGDGTRIYRVNADGTGLRGITSGPDDSRPVLSPDGRWVAFERGRVIGEDERGDQIVTLDLYVVPVDGGTPRLISRIAHEATWSPDGTKLAFDRFFGEGISVWTAAANGSGARQLARGQAPAWSPDGKRIAFDRWTGKRQEVFVMDSNGKGIRKLLRGSPREGNSPAWSPDRRSICFFGENHVYVVKADGSTLMRLVFFWGETSLRYPRWSPDGERILFAKYANTRNSPDNESVYVVRRDGTNLRRLVRPTASDPEWSSDGRSIAFVRETESSRSRTAGVYVMTSEGARPRQVARFGLIQGMDW